MKLKIKMNINDNFHNYPQARLLRFMLSLYLSARDNLDHKYGPCYLEECLYLTD